VRKSAFSAAVVLLLTLVAASPIGAGARTVKPKVVCYEYPRSQYRFRPHSCLFHVRGKPYNANLGFVNAKKLRWHFWSPRQAQARGKLGIVTYGWAPVRIRLSRPRNTCGETVFTRGRFKYRIHHRGRHHTKRFTISLDRCD
jgi:hypothetical protein